MDYRKLIEYMPVGYAHHRIIVSEDNIPIDYEYLEVNGTFEDQTGLKRENIVGKRVTQVLPDIADDEFDWINFYGEIALNGEYSEIDQYSRTLEKYYKIRVVCPKIGEFITYICDISEEHRNIDEKLELIAASNDIVFELDENYAYIDIIVQDEDILFIPKAEIIGRRVGELFKDEVLTDRILEALSESKISGEKKSLVYNSIVAGDNKWFYTEIKCIELKHTTKYIISVHDITEEKKIEKQLIESQEELERERELLETMLLSIGDAIISIDFDYNIQMLNQEAENLLGWTLSDAQGMHLDQVFNLYDKENPSKHMDISVCARDIGGELNEAILESKQGIEQIIEYRLNNVVSSDGSIRGTIIVFRDISDKKKKEEEVLFLSYNDQLTGLYNRRYFEQELYRLDQVENLPISLIMIDINGLKLTNDAFGHSAGDKLLVEVANTLSSSCRTNDVLARIGGDEFAIILPQTSVKGADSVTKRIYSKLEEKEISPIVVSASVGYGTKASTEENIQRAFRRAEDEMYKSKVNESQDMKERTLLKAIEVLFNTVITGKDHSDGVSKNMKMFAEAMGFDQDKIKNLELLGRVHDIGLIVLDPEILNKKKNLSNRDWQEFKRHSEIGYQILKSVNSLVPIAEYVLSHHERYDGDGYPDGLKGEEIPLESRMLAIADAYSAMTSDRVYKDRMTREEAMAELKRNAGTQFDPKLLDIFLGKVLKA